ncbi:MAG TPA: hypothetical protein VNU93_01195 [Verrucomicrobiae bacterium]|nr:hypothetical protein [Verrucomicrobiae bacterium]
MSLSAQQIQNKIDQAVKDPKRAENAAKADVYIHKKNRTIMDTTQQAVQKTPATTKKKKSKRCNKS